MKGVNAPIERRNRFTFLFLKPFEANSLQDSRYAHRGERVGEADNPGPSPTLEDALRSLDGLGMSEFPTAREISALSGERWPDTPVWSDDGLGEDINSTPQVDTGSADTIVDADFVIRAEALESEMTPPVSRAEMMYDCFGTPPSSEDLFGTSDDGDGDMSRVVPPLPAESPPPFPSGSPPPSPELPAEEPNSSGRRRGRGRGRGRNSQGSRRGRRGAAASVAREPVIDSIPESVEASQSF